MIGSPRVGYVEFPTKDFNCSFSHWTRLFLAGGISKSSKWLAVVLHDMKSASHYGSIGCLGSCSCSEGIYLRVHAFFKCDVWKCVCSGMTLTLIFLPANIEVDLNIYGNAKPSMYLMCNILYRETWKDLCGTCFVLSILKTPTNHGDCFRISFWDIVRCALRISKCDYNIRVVIYSVVFVQKCFEIVS